MSRQQPKRCLNFELSCRLKSLFYSTSANPAIRGRQLELLSKEPNIYIIREFLTESELEWLDILCTQNKCKFESSFTEDGDEGEVISNERTSLFIYLTKNQDSVTRQIEQRAADMVSVHSASLEPVQLVSYTHGQKFTMHHDAGTLDESSGLIELVCPRRLVTILVYLNTMPEGQGHTEFPRIGLSVRPERGCALMWCNVLPDGQPDPRTLHQGCSVEGNLRKFAMNIWITDQSLQDLALVAPKCKVNKKTHFDKSSSLFSSADRATTKFVNGDNNNSNYDSMHEERNNNGGTEEDPTTVLKPAALKKIEEGGGGNGTSKMEGEYIVERILAHSGNPKQRASMDFLVRWAGYSAKYDLWLPWRELKGNVKLHEYLVASGLTELLPKAS